MLKYVNRRTIKVNSFSKEFSEMNFKFVQIVRLYSIKNMYLFINPRTSHE